MFYQRDLLYTIYQVDTKLLDIKDGKILFYQNLDSLNQHKIDSLNQIITNQEIIAKDFSKLYKKEKFKKNFYKWSSVGIITLSGAFMLYQAIK